MIKIIYFGTPAISSTILAKLIVKDQVVFISGLNKPDDNVCEFSNYYDLIVPEDLLIQKTPNINKKVGIENLKRKRGFSEKTFKNRYKNINI